MMIATDCSMCIDCRMCRCRKTSIVVLHFRRSSFIVRMWCCRCS